jgi:hypothetical protein
MYNSFGEQVSEGVTLFRSGVDSGVDWKNYNMTRDELDTKLAKLQKAVK